VKPIGVVSKQSVLEVVQTHSSEDTCEQYWTKSGGGAVGAKGFDREKIIQQE
jgi:hypothetical protein